MRPCRTLNPPPLPFLKKMPARPKSSVAHQALTVTIGQQSDWTAEDPLAKPMPSATAAAP